jgi:hypothetical protein
MNITSAQYIQDDISSENKSICATIDGQEMFVPLDPANRHYQAIQEWVAKGNTIQPAE